jgi:hypothetical protein
MAVVLKAYVLIEVCKLKGAESSRGISSSSNSLRQIVILQ